MPGNPAVHTQASMPIDTRYHVETPEGIELVLRPAGLVVRALAFSVDLLVRGLLLGGLLLALSMLEHIGLGLGAIVLFVVNWWYMVLFEVLNQGRSPGKLLMGLRVTLDDGTPIGWSASLIRNLLRFVDMLPFGYFLGAVSCLQHPAFKRLGDLAAGSLVVYQEQPRERPQLPDAAPCAAPFSLSVVEQRALLSFAERQRELSPERARELAGLLAEPLQVAPGQALARINGIAHSLVGRQ